jgi:hypothetical protein
MAIYEIGHFYDKSLLRKDRVFFLVGGVGDSSCLSENNYKDNIIKYHDYCSELDAVYCIYKNFNDSIIGIEHYRRFFSNLFGSPLTYKKAQKILTKKKIILPIPLVVKETLFVQYSYCHYINDYYVLRDTVSSLFPDYTSDFDVVMSGKELFPFNMMITSNSQFKEYCDWLFKILFTCLKKMNVSERSSYQKRVLGYFGERLLNVWVHHNFSPSQIYKCEVVVLGKDGSRNHNKIEYFARSIKHRLSR